MFVSHSAIIQQKYPLGTWINKCADITIDANKLCVKTGETQYQNYYSCVIFNKYSLKITQL